MTEQWNTLLRAVEESPSNEIFKTCLDTILYNLVQVNLLYKEGWTRGPQEALSNLNHYVVLQNVCEIRKSFKVWLELPERV